MSKIGPTARQTALALQPALKRIWQLGICILAFCRRHHVAGLKAFTSHQSRTVYILSSRGRLFRPDLASSLHLSLPVIREGCCLRISEVKLVPPYC